MENGTVIAGILILLVFGGIMLKGSSETVGVEWVDTTGAVLGFKNVDGKPRFSSTPYT